MFAKKSENFPAISSSSNNHSIMVLSLDKLSWVNQKLVFDVVARHMGNEHLLQPVQTRSNIIGVHKPDKNKTLKIWTEPQ